jgi:tetrapyrrole methylase family protein/MazG family protein
MTEGLAELVTQVDAESRVRPGAPQTHPDFDALVRTVWRLRQPDGCPWDREQTHESIAQSLIEEAFEAVDAIEGPQRRHLAEELGDVLLQVLLHAQIADDAGSFDIDAVCRALNEKLVRRHPHVFGDACASTADETLGVWDRVKLQEQRDQAAGDEAAGTRPEGLLDSVPVQLPALMQAQKISRKAAAAGFEWETVDDVWDQVASEISEFKAAAPGSAQAELEFGDILFSLVNVARREHIDAESALRATCAKFRRRWEFMEDAARRSGRSIADVPNAEQEALWAQAKLEEKDL